MHTPGTSHGAATVAILMGCAMSLIAQPAFAVLYNLDFSTPPHTVGLPPATGGGPPPRNTVSSIPFGTPLVVSSFGVLIDQPLEFDSFDGQGDQIRLVLSDLPASTFYRLETEVLVENLATQGNLGILFDTPTVRTIRFVQSGNINIFVPGIISGSIGTFRFGTVVNLRVDVDLANDNWEIYLDNVLAHSGAFGAATAVTAIRFSTNVTSPPPGVSAGIDNVIVTEQSGPTAVPDPFSEIGTWGGIKGLYR
jgi:hypothetical protein